MATDRKQKIETLQKIVAGVDPRPKQIHTMMLPDTLSSDELEALLQLQKMNTHEQKEFLQTKAIDTEEKLRALLQSNELKVLYQIRPGDTLVIFEPSPGCEPLQDEPELLQQDNTVEPIEATEQDEPVITEESSLAPVFVPEIKKDNREKEQITFNLLGEQVERDRQRAQKMNKFMKRYNELN